MVHHVHGLRRHRSGTLPLHCCLKARGTARGCGSQRIELELLAVEVHNLDGDVAIQDVAVDLPLGLAAATLLQQLGQGAVPSRRVCQLLQVTGEELQEVAISDILAQGPTRIGLRVSGYLGQALRRLLELLELTFPGLGLQKHQVHVVLQASIHRLGVELSRLGKLRDDGVRLDEDLQAARVGARRRRGRQKPVLQLLFERHATRLLLPDPAAQVRGLLGFLAISGAEAGVDRGAAEGRGLGHQHPGALLPRPAATRRPH
mmetsp:Transcript_61725/g.201450  ORF Transcript_61725/g.201450 Transcript_61725/m.201450 type:complete len:260 (-) Transcript_61725:611-1390(-)